MVALLFSLMAAAAFSTSAPDNTVGVHSWQPGTDGLAAPAYPPVGAHFVPKKP